MNPIVANRQRVLFVGASSVASALPVARLVMERSPHNMLVGSGGLTFAKKQGIPTESREALLGECSMEQYQVKEK